MQKTDPDARRPFRVTFVRVTPLLGILFRLLLMFSLPVANWLRLPAWLAIGLVFDSVSGSRHSTLSPNALSPERIYASLRGRSHAVGR
jgi:APA family basic amino acid/polyamine antiporter